MHRSVMQNKKYMKWATKTSVEVVIVSGLQARGIDKNDPRAATFKGKDGKQYLINWPSLTVDQLKKLNSSKAAAFKVNGGYPTTHVIDPHTLEPVQTWNTVSAGALMDAGSKVAKDLKKKHGKGISRKNLAKFNKGVAKARELAKDGKLTNALGEAAKLQAASKKMPALLQEKADGLMSDFMSDVEKFFDEADALFARGEKKKAVKMIRPYLRFVRGTPLEARGKELIAKSKE